MEKKNRPRKSTGNTIKIIVYILSVLSVFLIIGSLCTVKQVNVTSKEHEVVDLNGIDFTDDVVVLSSNLVEYHWGDFYTSEDFAAGNISQENNEAKEPNYGTIRLLVSLPQDEIYALSSKSAFYAQRVFVDGKEVSVVGEIADNEESVVPRTRRYTVGIEVEHEVTEIIIQYSNFVHADSGGVYDFTIGYTDNVVRAEQQRSLLVAVITIVLITAALFFFGMFLFFQKSHQFLWFSLTCIFAGMHGLFSGGKLIMVLLPNLDWYLAIRLEYLSVYGIALFGVLYICSIFTLTINKILLRIYISYCLVSAILIYLLQPKVFTYYGFYMTIIAAIFTIYLLGKAIYHAIRKTNVSVLNQTGQILFLLGFGILLCTAILDIYGYKYAFDIAGLDFIQIGIMIMLFLHILALVFGFIQTQEELEVARQNELEMYKNNQMLEGLNRIKSEFLGNISHEMRTSLEVISGSTGLAITHIKRETVSDNTVNKLQSAEGEAVRLGRLVGQLLESATENEHKLKLQTTDVNTLFQQVIDFCKPICKKNNNQIESGEVPKNIKLLVNVDNIYQVLLNLVMNGNRYTMNGKILLSAKNGEGNIILIVKDNGKGISPELLPHIFERGVSGDDGSGFGLSICKQIIEEHGGNIKVESKVGEGTTIYLVFPNAETEASL